MMNDVDSRPQSTWVGKFAHAFRGAFIGIRGQSSFAAHFTFVALVIAAATFLGSGLLEWCLLLLCMTVVLTAEMFNSSLESLAKAIDQRQNRHLADGLDIASGAVLLAAFGAACVGSIVLLNRALAMFLGA